MDQSKVQVSRSQKEILIFFTCSVTNFNNCIDSNVFITNIYSICIIIYCGIVILQNHDYTEHFLLNVILILIFLHLLYFSHLAYL